MEKHASEHDTSAHCTITGQARTPSASTGSRAHAGKMLNGSAPFSALRPVALHAWTALSDAERRWYRQCRGRTAYWSPPTSAASVRVRKLRRPAF